MGWLARLQEDIEAARQRDPAARNGLEVLLAYPGIHAIIIHRLAHALAMRGWVTMPRLISHVARLLTGIEIHPRAQIGRRLFIDHGMGIVIGETAIVGDDCHLYQGVTLGGTSTRREKRHPTLDRGVIFGSGAQILGPITVGADARVGANAVVTKDVPPGCTAIGIPARLIACKDPEAQKAFVAYGTPGDIPDPTQRALDGMRAQLNALASRVEELEGELAKREAAERERRAQNV